MMKKSCSLQGGGVKSYGWVGGGGGGGGGGGCIWIIASALWSRDFSLRLVNELNCIRQRPGTGPRA